MYLFSTKQTFTRGIIAALLFCCGLRVAQAEDLMQVYSAIQENDPAWHASESAYEAGKQSAGLGRAYLLPSVVLSGEHKEVTQKPDCPPADPLCSEAEVNFTATSYQVQVVQPLFDKGKWHIYKSEKANAQLANIEYQDALQTNIYDTVDLYFKVLRAQEDYYLAEAERKALETQLKEIKAKADAGVTDLTEVIETQASYDLATVNQITLLGYLKVAFEDLISRTKISKPLIMGLAQDFPIKHLEPFDEQLWVKKAEENSPKLLALRQQVSIAKQNYRERTSAIYPSIDLFATLVDQDQEGGFYFTNGQSEAIGVRVQWPVFAGLGDYYTAKQQKALFMQSSENIQAETQEFTQIVKNRFRSIYTDVLTVNARKQSLISSERALKAVKAQYDIGSRDMIDVLDAQERFFSAQREYAHSRYDYVMDLMQLKLFVGELRIEDLNAINEYLVVDDKLMRFEQIP